MSLLIHIAVVIIIVGVLLWVAQAFPMPAPLQRLLYGLVIIGVLLWIVQELGLFGGWGDHDRGRRNDYRAPDPSNLPAVQYAVRAPRRSPLLASRLS